MTPNPLTEAEYRAHPAISYSDLTAMLRCEAAWLSDRRLRVTDPAAWRMRREANTTPAMRLGRLFEATVGFDEAGIKACMSDPAIYTKGSANVAPRIRAEYAILDAMIATWNRQTQWPKLGQCDMQRQWFAVLDGVEIRGMSDLWFPATAVMEDIKTAADFDDEWADAHRHPWLDIPRGRGPLPWWVASYYDLQAAMYMTLARLNDVVGASYYIRAVTKQAVPDVVWLDVTTHPAVLAAMDYLPRLVTRAAALIAGADSASPCGGCEYCRARKVYIAPWRPA